MLSQPAFFKYDMPILNRISCVLMLLNINAIKCIFVHSEIVKTLVWVICELLKDLTFTNGCTHNCSYIFRFFHFSYSKYSLLSSSTTLPGRQLRLPGREHMCEYPVLCRYRCCADVVPIST